MADECYAMVRGSGLRVTNLDARGRIDNSDIRYAVSKSVTKVTINPVVDEGGNELIRTADREPRLHFVTNDTTIKYTVDVDFLRCDPALLSLVSGVPVVTNASGDVVGFDAETRLPAKSFALEVWSKLVGFSCVLDAIEAGFGEGNFGEMGFGGIAYNKPYGYTLFPFLKGGTLSGFVFSNGLVSFNLKGARTQRNSRWNVGPYDLEGPLMRLFKPVSRNTMWRSLITSGSPPEQTNGIASFSDIIDGNVGPDILDGNVGPYIVSGN